MWAIASGIEGNLAADEAVVADLRKSRQEVENFYLIGDRPKRLHHYSSQAIVINNDYHYNLNTYSPRSTVASPRVFKNGVTIN